MRKKNIFAILLAATLTMTFVSCGNTSVESGESTSAELLLSEESKSETTVESEVSESEEITTKETTSVSKENISGTNDILDLAEKDVADTISELNTEYEELIADIDTYDKYVENQERVEAYYSNVYTKTYQLTVRLREYSITYAEQILSSDMSNDDKYDELEELYDHIYEDAGDEIFDEIYDGVMSEMFDTFYDGILDEKDDSISYKDWSDTRSDEYKLWSDTRSDVYDEWSDYRSDVYDFWSDLRGDVWSDDIESANEEIADFRKDTEKLKKDSEQTSDNQPSAQAVSETEAAEEEAPAENLVDGMRPEFKEALDSYEAFFTEYCEFIKKFNENPSDLSLLEEYTEYLEQYSETMDKLSALDNGEMNDAETKYYLEVTNRINKMLLDAV